jgi:hypothetical protein
MNKIKISFVQYGGISYRSLIDLAISLNKSLFDVNYFWCHPGKDLFSNFNHLQASPEQVLVELQRLKGAGVNPIQFRVEKRFIPDPTLPWIGTDFFEVFEAIKTDIVFTWKGGRSEYPFMHLGAPVVEWNVFGMVDRSQNLVKSLAISPLCKELYLKNGGEPAKSEVMYVPVLPPTTTDNLRQQLSIDDDAIVCGMHQRPEDAIFSPISLDAVQAVSKKLKNKIYFLILGGSELYQKHAKSIGLNNFHQLKYESGIDGVSRFLNTLNIYTHARTDGETLGRVLQEAMMHKLPIISHEAQWNAHIETIGVGGVVVSDPSKYAPILTEWISDPSKAKKIGSLGYDLAIQRYSFPAIVSRFEEILFEVARNEGFTAHKVIKNHGRINGSINYAFLIRYFSIKSINKISSAVFGRAGPGAVLKLQQLYNRLRYK